MSRQNPAVGDIQLFRPTKLREDASVWCSNIHQARIVYGYPTFEGASATSVWAERRLVDGWAVIPAAELAAVESSPEAIRELCADVLYRVDPIGDLTRSTEDSFETWCAPAFRVVAVIDRAVLLTDKERRRLGYEWALADRARAGEVTA